MLDLETFFIAVYTVVDDIYKEAVAPLIGNRNGPEPRFSDSELITLSLVAEFLGIDSERAFLSFVRKNFSYLFPDLPERSRYNRKRRDLAWATDRVRKVLLHYLGTYSDSCRIIDSIPIPVCKYCRAKRGQVKVFVGEADFGVCESKEEKFYGFKLHFLLSLEGVPTDFTVASANHHDVKLVWDLVDPYQNLILIGDKGYISQSLEEELKELRNILLVTAKRKNQKVQNPIKLDHLITKTRKIIETVAEQLIGQFNLSRNLAKSMWGFITRIISKITSYTLGIYLNRLFSFPLLNVKELIF